MKPKLIEKEFLVKRKVWQCNNDNHSHRTKTGAEKCIIESEKGAKKPYKWDKYLKHLLLCDVLNSPSFAAVGRDWGLSTTQVSRVFDRYVRRELSQITRENGFFDRFEFYWSMPMPEIRKDWEAIQFFVTLSEVRCFSPETKETPK